MESDVTTISGKGEPFSGELGGLIGFLEECALREQLFTAWAFGNREVAVSAFFADEAHPPLEGNCDWPGTLHPPFDLASLTKTLLTGRTLRRLLPATDERWQAPLRELAGEVSGNEALAAGLASVQSSVTLEHLLNHRSGLPAWRWLGRVRHERDPGFLISGILAELGHETSAERYSDLGYVLLAQFCEAFAGRPWSALLAELNESCGTRFWHSTLTPERSRQAIPSFPYLLTDHDINPGDTAWHEFGPVHDTNANILSELKIVGGHAGLFGHVLDVLAAAEHAVELALPGWQDQPQRRYVGGFDTPAGPDSLAGPEHWPLSTGERIMGHLGFTGTAYWVGTCGDAIRQTNVLLTNRTASRLRYGCNESPRMLVLTDRRTGTEQHFLKRNGGTWKNIERNTAEETVVFHARTFQRMWNRADLRAAPDIRRVRTHVARKLWRTKMNRD